MSGNWRRPFVIHPYSDLDKVIRISGPYTLEMNVDFDDVDHKGIEEELPNIVNALNDWFEKRSRS